jgi:hypothetical protein
MSRFIGALKRRRPHREKDDEGRREQQENPMKIRRQAGERRAQKSYDSKSRLGRGHAAILYGPVSIGHRLIEERHVPIRKRASNVADALIDLGTEAQIW